MKGILQKLLIIVAGPQRTAFKHEVYFAPFHAPGVATSDLSRDAIALKSRIP